MLALAGRLRSGLALDKGDVLRTDLRALAGRPVWARAVADCMALNSVASCTAASIDSNSTSLSGSHWRTSIVNDGFRGLDALNVAAIGFRSGSAVSRTPSR
jgi:hypothetical protein